MRHRHGRRAGRGGSGLKGTTATALLRPALEASVDVARQGERSMPVVPAPASLRRYLTFAKLPDPALDVARRVLEESSEFRDRVAAAVSEAAVGRAGWLFLNRPDGWRDELDVLLQEAAAAEIAAKDERHERGAQRRLAGAEAALARADAAARASAADLSTAQDELHHERLAARALADEVDRLRDEVTRLADERGEAIRRLKSAEAIAADRSAGLRSARHQIRMLQAELQQAAPGVSVRSVPVGTPEEVDPPFEFDRRAAATALDEAAAGLSVLGGALDALRRLLGPVEEVRGGGGAVGGGGGVATARRQPVTLPPAIYDDAPEAGHHLVRTPGVLVLVDGYNISHAQWYGLPPREQRARLLDACDELQARVGAGVELEVVFDGEGEEPTVGGGGRAGVRYRFTPAGVEADDVLLARVEEEPPARPVVVVSSDRRVRDGARQRGANVLGARQFLAVLGR